jgi:hypothetical protein
VINAAMITIDTDRCHIDHERQEARTARMVSGARDGGPLAGRECEFAVVL